MVDTRKDGQKNPSIKTPNRDDDKGMNKGARGTDSEKEAPRTAQPKHEERKGDQRK